MWKSAAESDKKVERFEGKQEYGEIGAMERMRWA